MAGQYGKELTQLVLPYFSLGLIVAGIFLFFSTLRFFPERKYLSVLLITLVSFAYILLEIKIRSILMYQGDTDKVWVYIYLQNLFRLLYLPAIPLFLHEFVFISPFINRVHRILLTLLSLIALFTIILALVAKNAYLNKDMVYFIKGSFGPEIRIAPPFWYGFISTTFFALICYSLVITCINSFIPRFSKDFFFLFAGLVLASYFYISSLGLELWGYYLPPLKEVPYSRMSVGLGVMTFFIYLGIFRIFLSQARDTVNTERKLNREQAKLIRTAFNDATTQIPNRTAFLRDLNLLVEQKSPKAAVMFMDLNQFVNINISYGPVLGDQFLRILGQRFIENLPDSAKVYRIEGDEFALIIHPLHSESAPEEIAILLHGWLNQGVNINGETYRLTAAIGISIVPEHGDKLLEILRNSKRALMDAKKRRLPVVTFQPDATTNAELRIKAVQILRQAIEEKRFHLVYQPVLDSQNRICEVEVLVRWDNAVEAFKESGLFIPVAEKAGLMHKLGDLIIDLFLEDYATISNASPSLIFSLNISGSQFLSREIGDNLIFKLSRKGVPMEKIQFEIPEEYLMPVMGEYRDILDKFRNKGIKIAVDNFASHCLNIKHLGDIPLDTLKIDMNLLKDVPENPKAEDLMKSLLKLGEILDLSIVVKGIQREEQYRFLQENGCSYFQGFYIYPPLGRDELCQLIEEKR